MKKDTERLLRRIGWTIIGILLLSVIAVIFLAIIKG